MSETVESHMVVSIDEYVPLGDTLSVSFSVRSTELLCFRHGRLVWCRVLSVF